MKFIKSLSLLLVPFLLGLSCVSGLLVANAPSAFADYDICADGNIPNDIKLANGCTSGTTGTLPELKDVVLSILNGIIAITGVIAVIFIVIGGVNYMTSSGDSNKVQKAKGTITYACIGLAVCALSAIIVNFVIVGLIGAGDATSTGGVETVGSGEWQLQDYIVSILNGIIAALGVVCVIFMIIGGVNYMSSAGDAQKVSKGKNTLLYAGIGLVICVLSFAIVNFLISNIIGAQGSTGATYTDATSCADAGGIWTGTSCDF